MTNIKFAPIEDHFIHFDKWLGDLACKLGIAKKIGDIQRRQVRELKVGDTIDIMIEGKKCGVSVIEEMLDGIVTKASVSVTPPMAPRNFTIPIVIKKSE